MPMENNPRREQPRAVAHVWNLAIPKSELNNSYEGSQSSCFRQRTSGTFGAARYRLVGAGDKTEGDGPDSDADEDGDATFLVECPSCDFEIALPLACRLEIDPEDMICPVCDEILVDAINFAHTSNSQRRTLKSDKSSVSSGNPVVSEKKVPSKGCKHESVPNPLVSPFIHNMPDSTSSGVHPGVDPSSNASKISNPKGSGTDASADSCDEEDIEGKRLKASYIQELLLSTI